MISLILRLLILPDAFLESFDKTKLIEAFITQSYKHWYLILKRDRDYFVKHAESIFSGISAGNISAFSKLFEKGKDGKLIIEQEDEDCISDYFNSLVKISIRYIHRMRQPVKEKDGSYSYKNKAAFSFVDLEKEVKDWNMKL